MHFIISSVLTREGSRLLVGHPLYGGRQGYVKFGSSSEC